MSMYDSLPDVGMRDGFVCDVFGWHLCVVAACEVDGGPLVAHAVTIVGSREDSHDITLVSPVVSIHDKLMSTCDSHQVIGVIELFGDVLAKRVASTSWRDTPTTSVIRIRPKQVAHGTFVWYFLYAVQLLDVIEAVN